jgi:hypothetical protein
MRIDINTSEIAGKIEKRIERVQKILDLQVLKDSNYFAPADKMTLIRSGKMLGNGILRWDTPYAKKQYYEFPRKSKDINPNAMPKWFEEAKYRYIKDWRDLANAQYNQ